MAVKCVRWYDGERYHLAKGENGKWYFRTRVQTRYGWGWTRWKEYGILESVERRHTAYTNMNGNDLVDHSLVFNFRVPHQGIRSTFIDYDSRHNSKFNPGFRLPD